MGLELAGEDRDALVGLVERDRPAGLAGNDLARRELVGPGTERAGEPVDVGGGLVDRSLAILGGNAGEQVGVGPLALAKPTLPVAGLARNATDPDAAVRIWFASEGSAVGAGAALAPSAGMATMPVAASARPRVMPWPRVRKCTWMSSVVKRSPGR